MLCSNKYYITADRWTSGFLGYKYPPFLKLQGNMVRFYKTFADLTDYEACLPRDECYEVVVGGLPTDAYTLSFDGKAVAVDIGDEFMFDGNNPVTSTEVGTCTKPVCKDTEALLEIHYWNGDFAYTSMRFVLRTKTATLFFRAKNQMNHTLSTTLMLVCQQMTHATCATRIDEVGYEYEWDLNGVSNNSSASVVSGVVPIGPGTSPLTHKIMCIPKGSCSSFYTSAPNVTREVVRLVVDDNSTSWGWENATYSNVTWRAPYDKFGSRSDNQTTNMGSCTVGGLCDEQTQDLFDLELHMPANYKETYSIFPYIIMMPTIRNSRIGWNFGYTNIGDGWYLLRGYHYNTHAYDLDSTYGVIECVPKGDCDLSFNITPTAPVESYTVKKNGIQLDDTDTIDALMTPFGQNCSASNSLSGGAVAGIVIASVAAVGAVIFGLVWYKRRQNQSPNAKVGEAEEDPEA
eukprot:scaffold11605_cov83-Skeletonema_marinoi.AAC.1